LYEQPLHMGLTESQLLGNVGLSKTVDQPHPHHALLAEGPISAGVG